MSEQILRKEEFTQTRGANRLELRGGGSELALFVDGEPLIFDAADCAGSVGRFTVLLNGAPQPEQNASVARFAAQGFRGPEPPSVQVRALLDLLPNGRYTLALRQLSHYQGPDWSDYDGQPGDARVFWYYPFDGVYQEQFILLQTQHSHTLSDDVVLRYMEQIEAGASPALITLGARDEKSEFVLDGHHKLHAYWLCRAKPWALRIESEQVRPLSSSEAKNVLQGYGKTVGLDYLQHKSRVNGS